MKTAGPWADSPVRIAGTCGAFGLLGLLSKLLSIPKGYYQTHMKPCEIRFHYQSLLRRGQPGQNRRRLIKPNFLGLYRNLIVTLESCRCISRFHDLESCVYSDFTIEVPYREGRAPTAWSNFRHLRNSRNPIELLSSPMKSLL